MRKDVNFAELARTYRDVLLDDVVPFWMEHSPDREHGGYYTCLDRDGSVYSTEKPVQLLARQLWFFSHLCNRVEPRDEWLEMARLGYEFLARHAFDEDGRTFCVLTEDGTPIDKRHSPKVDALLARAFGEYGTATGRQEAVEHARGQFPVLIGQFQSVQGSLPENLPETPATVDLFLPSPILELCQQLRQFSAEPAYDEYAHKAAMALRYYFVAVEERALFGTTYMQSVQVAWSEARIIRSGMVASNAFGLMTEGAYRHDMSMLHGGAQAMDFVLAACWDDQYGGLYDTANVLGEKGVEPEHDMKFWWAHCEALRASLLAYKLTHEKRYLDWFARIHQWAFSHFPDAEFGEWFGCLYRDGSVADRRKGGQFNRSFYPLREPSGEQSHEFPDSQLKGMLHLPRALLECWRLLEEFQADASRRQGAAPPQHGEEGPA